MVGDFKLKQEISVGLVCLARKTFDYQAAAEIYSNIKEDLKKIEQVQWEIVEELVIEVDDAQNAAHRLASKDIDT